MPPAALISIIQKGLQYVEAEVSINEVSHHLYTATYQLPFNIQAFKDAMQALSSDSSVSLLSIDINISEIEWFLFCV